MRCVVTGAAGHLGSFLTRLLIAEGHETLAIVRREDALWRLQEVIDGLPLAYAGASGDAEQLARLLEGFGPDVAFHLAWKGVTAGNRDSDGQITENLIATIRMFEQIRDSGCPVFVGVGSQAEFGPYDVALTEDLPVRPVTAYGVSKLSAGMVTAELAAHAGMRHAWVRLLASYGPRDDTRRLIPVVAVQLLRGETPRLSPGEQLRDYLYVEDAARALLGIALADGASGVFVLGSGHAVSVREICERLRDLIDPGSVLAFGAHPYRPDQAMRVEADIGRIKSVIGWSPRVALDQGLARTVDYYRANGGTP